MVQLELYVDLLEKKELEGLVSVFESLCFDVSGTSFWLSLNFTSKVL